MYKRQEVLTGREAFKVDPEARAVLARNLETGAEERYEYDELIIAVGASASVPPLEGVGLKGVFTTVSYTHLPSASTVPDLPGPLRKEQSAAR